MKKFVSVFSALAIFVIALAFNITAYAEKQIAISSVELANTGYVYTGNKIVPEFTVIDENGNVVDDNDENFYIQTYNSRDVGTATLKVTGKNNYKGSVKVDYKIKPRAISSTSTKGTKITLDKSPEIVVKYNNKLLEKGVDYDVSVSSSNKAGKIAKVTITGLGNFTGTKTVEKVVYPCGVNGLGSSKRNNNGFDLAWNSLENKGITNYKVYKCNEKGENKKLVVDTNKNSAKITGYKAGEYAYLVVRAYVTVDGTNYYGDYSNVYKTVTKPEKVVNIKNVKSKDEKTIKLGWEKAACTGYQIEYSTDKAFKKNVKRIEINGSSKTSKSISIKNNGKIYYSRVRAFRRYKYGSKVRTCYGDWSNKLSTEYNKIYSSYKTAHVQNKNRTTNLKLACKAINGTVLKPGEVFSFNKIVGKRTAKKGYKPATIFTGSSGTSQSLGGGICQVASTMFNATLLANLKIVERHQHSQRVAYCPLGRDAAIYWGSEDFKFKNTSGYPIKIEMKCENGYVYCNYKVNYDVSPKKVTLKVTRNRNNFTLKRYVGGKCNYTAKSKY